MDSFEAEKITPDPSIGAVEVDPTKPSDHAFRQILRNSAWAIGSTGIAAGCLLIETALLGRHLGVRKFGVFVLLLAYPEAVQMILDFRTREAMTKYLSEFLALGDRLRAVGLVKALWLLDLAVSALAFVVVLGTAPYVAHHLVARSDAAYLMVIAAIGTFFGSLDATAGTILRVFDRFPLALRATAATSLLRLGLIVAAIVAGAGVGGIVWARVAAEVATTLIMGAITLRVLKGALWAQRGAPLRVLRGRGRELGRFLFSTNLAALLKLASSKLDVLIIGFLATPTIAGTYKVAVQFGTSPLLLSDPLFVAVYPSFSRWWALGLRDQIRSIGRRATVGLAVVAIPAGVALALASKPILSATVGEDFAAAAKPLIIVLTASVPIVVLFWTRAVMLSMGEAAKVTVIVAIGAAVELLLLFILVPPLGATGGAVSLAAMYLVTLALTLAHLRRRAML